MATIVPPQSDALAESPPLLYDGQRLLQPEFHKLYEAIPEGKKFELIDGVVYMAAAYRRPHGRFGLLIGGLILAYESATPGVEGLANATTILDDKNEPEPDYHLRILSEYGGQAHVTSDQYIQGPPELVIEISHSTLNLDLKTKSTIYRQQGVKEYLVIDVEAAQIHWFVWPDGRREIDSDGILRSVTFPGFWVHVEALFQERFPDLRNTLEKGIEQPEHAAFLVKLQNSTNNKSS